MGFKSLQEVAEIFGVTATCLRNWHNEQPQKFRIVLIGARFYKKEQGES